MDSFDQILRHDWIFFGEWILSQSMLNFEIISMNNEVKIGEITLANCLAIKTQPCIIYEKEEWCIIYYYAPNIGRVKIIGRNKNGDEVPLIILTDYNIK